MAPNFCAGAYPWGKTAKALPTRGEAGSDPRGHLGVTWGVYLCAGKPPWADIILSHPPDLTRCDSVIGLAIFRTEAPPAEIYISEYQESTGFYYHNVSVIFQPFVLMVNVSATVSWLAILR